MTAMAADQCAAQPVVVNAVRRLREVSGAPVAFGGPVDADREGFVISVLSGTTTESLLRLRIACGEGLGGKALTLGKPAVVQDYPQAKGITHHYDEAVAPERLRAVIALPIRVNRVPRAMVYVADRRAHALGDRFLDRAMPVIAAAERELVIEEEVRKRIAGGPPSEHLREMGELRAELLTFTDAGSDEAMKTRLRTICDRFTALVPPAQANDVVQAFASVRLAPRELDVLAEVAKGSTNSEIARYLGLQATTVKSYLKTAMRKLEASNRVQAINRARAAGLLA